MKRTLTLKEKYEVHHGIRILDSALIQAAKLSDRYITDRFLPDKAIDLIDEAASKVQLQGFSVPDSMKEGEKYLHQLMQELQPNHIASLPSISYIAGCTAAILTYPMSKELPITVVATSWPTMWSFRTSALGRVSNMERPHSTAMDLP